MSQSASFAPPRPAVPASRRRRTSLVPLLLAFALSGAPVAPGFAAELPTRAEARAVNENTIGIVFHFEPIYRRLIDDMAVKFADTADLRVVPIIGVNHVQTIYDMLYLKNVDLGIVHSDVLEYMARTERYPRVYQRISNLAELSTEKVAVIAGEQYRSLEDLRGKRVNFHLPGKGQDVTGTVLFDTIGVEVEPTRLDQAEALEKVKSGEIAAMIYLVKEPIEAFSSLSPADGIRLIGLPQTEELLAHYRKAQLTSADFPELIKGEGAVPALELSVIVAAYNWTEANPARYEKSRRFAAALLEGFDELRSEGDAELWKNASVDSDVPGVQRLATVETILAERRARAEEAEAAAARVAEMETRQRELMKELAEQLEGGTADPAELAEIERLLEQMKTVLEQ